ncbi:cupin domain-containing protein [Roseovarius spongiae]|uniref:Cupin domain-containing protein n=1 Tax=Roseovarius spongiae TaxID=2320272 RepID=A0A3A8AY18_9RHOB|nr:dimethylsulfonioproprionate lyase family protein [Roseovarius spongiae]RKF16716.1 cupin domain-containing protein [Roseovarius spongiae]
MRVNRDILRDELIALHARTPALGAFCALPDPLCEQALVPYVSPAAALMQADPGGTTAAFERLRDALVAATPDVRWRETYKDTDIGEDFVSKFACYQLIGPAEAPFNAPDMRSFVVWTPPGLHYPWHHHPAEEIYVVLAGEAEFAVHGAPSRTLRPGDHVLHASMQPHAMTTRDSPVMAYVAWRGDLTTPPVFTLPEMVSL